MIVGVMSDSHGRIDAIRSALQALRAQKTELLIHCGDIGDADTVAVFTGWNAHFVFGNCDWDRNGIRAAIEEIGAALHEPFGELNLDAVSIAWTHGDQFGLLESLERSDHYDFVFYGHTHVAEQHRTGRTQVVNPGALFRAKVKTCLVLDTVSRELTPITI
jgi:putative phosphoesterase